MRATAKNHRSSTWRKLSGVIAASILALTVLGGTVQAADSREFSTTVGNPTAASQGGVTKFDVTVQSGDNQTIANVVLKVPGAGTTLPAGTSIVGAFGPDAGACSVANGALSCDLGNLAAYDGRQVSVLASVATSVPVGNTITFTASAETNNENGSNRQIEFGTSGTLSVVQFSADSITTFGLIGPAGTSGLDKPGAGNLSTTVNLLQDNGGKGNSIIIAEATNSTQPSYCVTLKLTCQPDFTDVTVNAGEPVSPYLETTLTAKVPKSYNIKKAFVIHVLSDGVTVEDGFPLYNKSATSCDANPDLVPCADFSLSKDGILKVTVHTATNGKFSY